MTIKFSDLEMAFFFVGSDQPGMHNAYLDRETGNIFYTSEMGDSDDLPAEIFETERYLEIPHKNDLDLGKALVLDFTAALITFYGGRVCPVIQAAPLSNWAAFLFVAFLGGIGLPLAYYGVVPFGALTFHQPLLFNLMVTAALWAAVTPLLLFAAAKINEKFTVEQ